MEEEEKKIIQSAQEMNLELAVSKLNFVSEEEVRLHFERSKAF